MFNSTEIMDNAESLVAYVKHMYYEAVEKDERAFLDDAPREKAEKLILEMVSNYSYDVAARVLAYTYIKYCTRSTVFNEIVIKALSKEPIESLLKVTLANVICEAGRSQYFYESRRKNDRQKVA